jgi:hypothetical protein
MPQNDDTDDSTEPDDEPPASIDTNVDAFREKIEHPAAGEPFAIDVAFRAGRLRRVDLEREESESFTDWIRDAVDERRACVEHGDVPKGDEPPRSWPVDYTPEHDTPDEELIAAVSPAAPGDWIPVTVEVPAGVLDAVERNRGERQPVADWIRGAVVLRFSAINREVEIQPPVRVDVPPAVAQRARLWAEHKVARTPGENYHDALRDALLGLVQPQTEYLVDGEPIASFANPNVVDEPTGDGA